jgi:two-component system, NtrC family, response regulator AtoC
VIAATNRDLEDAVKQGRFREDLYYRLNVMQITMPALREHPSDVPLLVDHYITVFNREFRKNARGVTVEAMTLLKAYRWPGNIRELRNAIERAMLLADADWLTPDLLPLFAARGSTAQTMELPEEGVHLETLERELVVQALRRTGGNQTKAAVLLGLNRDQIRYRIEKFGLDKPAPA